MNKVRTKYVYMGMKVHEWLIGWVEVFSSFIFGAGNLNCIDTYLVKKSCMKKVLVENPHTTSKNPTSFPEAEKNTYLII